MYNKRSQLDYRQLVKVIESFSTQRQVDVATKMLRVLKTIRTQKQMDVVTTMLKTLQKADKQEKDKWLLVKCHESVFSLRNAPVSDEHAAWTRRRRVLALRESGMKLKDIAEALHISIERVRQIAGRAERERKRGNPSPMERYITGGVDQHFANLRPRQFLRNVEKATFTIKVPDVQDS